MSRLVAEEFPGLRYIGVRMADVAGAKLAVKRLELREMRELRKQPVSQLTKKLIQSRTLSDGHVVNLIDCLDIFRGCGEQVGLNSVGYITKIAARFPVSIDVNWFVVHHSPNPLWDDGGIGAVRILTGAKYVEVTQADGLHTIASGKDVCIKFIHSL